MDPLQKPYLRLMGIASLKVVRRLLPEVNIENENELWFFVDFATSTYRVGTSFDIIVNGKTHQWNHDYRIELTQVTDQLGGSLDQIEKGYKTICSFKFTPKIPPQIKNLYELSDWDVKDRSILIGRHQDIEIFGPTKNMEDLLNIYQLLVLEKMVESHKKHFTISEISNLIPHTSAKQYHNHIYWLAQQLVNRGRLKEEGEERFILVD
jgi:hypothetical protein